jgi:hypothetical protein
MGSLSPLNQSINLEPFKKAFVKSALKVSPFYPKRLMVETENDTKSSDPKKSFKRIANARNEIVNRDSCL